MKRIDQEILTSAEVAAELHVTPDRIRQLAREGKLPCMCTRSGQRIFLAKDVDALKAKRSLPSESLNSQNSQRGVSNAVAQ